MTSKRRKVRSTRRERDEQFGHKRTRTQSHQSENERKDSHDHRKERGRKEKRFCPEELSSTIITARRLTVGVKGIFGNAKNSSSVYREIKERIENRKLSKRASSEIELSLSRIIPSRNKTSKYSSFTATSTISKRISDDEITDKSVTPAYSHETSCRSVRSVASSNKSAISSSSKVTPRMVTPENVNLNAKTPYLKIAADIKSGLSNQLIFNDGQLIKELKDEIQQIYAERSTLTVNPLFRRADCEQVGQKTAEVVNDLRSGNTSQENSQAMDVSPAVSIDKMKNDQSVPSVPIYSSDKHLNNSLICSGKSKDLPSTTTVEMEGLSTFKPIHFADQPGPVTSSSSMLTSPTSFSLTTLQSMAIPQTVCYAQPSTLNPTFMHPPPPMYNNPSATSMYVQPSCMNPINPLQVNSLQPNMSNVNFTRPVLDIAHSFQPTYIPTSNPISNLNQMTFMPNNSVELGLNSRPISTYDVNLLQMPNTNLHHENIPETNLATGDVYGSSMSQENRSLSLMTIQDILNQPINKLRCYRKRSSTKPLEPSVNYAQNTANDNVTDFLDCIDLTSDVLKVNTKTDDVDFTAPDLKPTTSLTSTADVSEFALRFGIEKPPLESPSPPPYYRMSMF